MAADDVDGGNTAVFRWWWIDAVRYVVALAVTALIVTVIAHAVHVLLRPDVLVVLVDKGFVAVEPGTPAGNLSFGLDLEFANPSGRVVIYYEDIMAYLYGRANNVSSDAVYFVTIPVKDISLKQDSTEFVYLHAYPNLNSQQDYKSYFDLFNSSGNKGIRDGVVAVQATLTVGLYSWSNQTARTATYYCWPVPIGGDSSEDSASGRVVIPSGRVVIYYEDITAYLYGRANNKTTASFFANIPFKEGISLKQDSTKFEYLHTYPDLNSQPDYKPFFRLFNSSANKGIPDGVVVVNGTLTVGLYSWNNQTARTATYYCWPVAIGGDSSEDDSASGAQCSDDPPTPGASLT